MSTPAEGPLVPAKLLESYFIALFEGWGASPDAARQVADHLIEANLAGHDSHGALRAPWYLEMIEKGDLNPAAKPVIARETPTTAIVDGGWGFGQPASKFAMDTAIAKAKAMGIACVTVRNANHMGRAGYYTSMASACGMLALGCVNLHGTSPSVIPFGGIDRRLPTNPFSVAYPTDREPNFLADFTSSVAPEGKLQVRRNKGLPAPDHWVVDHDGNETSDPWAFYRDPAGALQPLGIGAGMAHKGYALAMAVEGLAGGLSEAGCANATATHHGNACWYTVVNIEAFTPLADFKARVGEMIEYVKSSRKAKGVEEILYPGEPEYRTRKQRLAEGIQLDARTWEWMAEMAAKKNIPVPKLG